MATYNGERFISAQLESIRGQTAPPNELIVVDDQSSDKTIEIVERFARSVNFPVRLKRNSRRKGYGATFMSAASKCDSDIISFCDQDDVWDNRKLELCLTPFADRSVLMVYHNAIVVDEQLRTIGDLGYIASRSVKMRELELGPLRFPKGFTSLFRRDLMRLAPYWADSLGFNASDSPESHDQFFPFLANAFGCIAYRPEFLAKYRRHGSNAGEETRWKLNKFERAVRAASRDLRGWSNMAKTFRRRAEILETIAAKPPNGFSATTAMRASAYYRAYAHLYCQRVDTYQQSTFVERMRAFRRVVVEGGYNGDAWSKGISSAAKDFFRGVLGI